jgi:hypothetical protein
MTECNEWKKGEIWQNKALIVMKIVPHGSVMRYADDDDKLITREVV